MRSSAQSQQLLTRLGCIMRLVEQLIVKRKHLIGANNESLRQARAHGLGLEAGQRVRDRRGVGTWFASSKAAFQCRFVDNGRLDPKFQSGSLQQATAKRAC
jgi:hypothetical protein